MRVLDVRWFTSSQGNVGIVQVEMNDEHEPPRKVTRYFVSPVSGQDQAQDAQNVAEWGASFPEHVGKVLFRVPFGCLGEACSNQARPGSNYCHQCWERLVEQRPRMP